MALLTVCTWLWGDKYGRDHVARLAAGVRRNLAQPYRFVCVTDKPDLDIPGVETYPIEDKHLPPVLDGCYTRLVMFSPEWQRAVGVEDRLVCLDLDSVVVGPLDPLFDRPEPFVILHGGHYSPCPFNGSVMMIRPGARSELWTGFDLTLALKIAHADGTNRGTDQTWIAANAPDAAGWRCGPESGIYAFHKPGWPGGDDLPKGARLIVFPGRRDPSRFRHLPWIKEHWR